MPHGVREDGTRWKPGDPMAVTPEIVEIACAALRKVPNVSAAAREAGVSVHTLWSAIKRGGELADALMCAHYEGMEADLEELRDKATNGVRIAATEKGGTKFRRNAEGKLVPHYIRRWDPAYDKQYAEGVRKCAELLIALRNAGSVTIEHAAAQMIAADTDPEHEPRGTTLNTRQSTGI